MFARFVVIVSSSLLVLRSLDIWSLWFFCALLKPVGFPEPREFVSCLSQWKLWGQLDNSATALLMSFLWLLFCIFFLRYSKLKFCPLVTKTHRGVFMFVYTHKHVFNVYVYLKLRVHMCKHTTSTAFVITQSSERFTATAMQ